MFTKRLNVFSNIVFIINCPSKIFKKRGNNPKFIVPTKKKWVTSKKLVFGVLFLPPIFWGSHKFFGALKVRPLFHEQENIKVGKIFLEKIIKKPPPPKSWKPLMKKPKWFLFFFFSPKSKKFLIKSFCVVHPLSNSFAFFSPALKIPPHKQMGPFNFTGKNFTF